MLTITFTLLLVIPLTSEEVSAPEKFNNLLGWLMSTYAARRTGYNPPGGTSLKPFTRQWGKSLLVRLTFFAEEKRDKNRDSYHARYFFLFREPAPVKRKSSRLETS